MSDSLWPHGLHHARPPHPSPTPGACSNSCPSSQWYHPTISSSVVPFSSHLQSFPESGSFQMNQFFTSCPKYWTFSFSISPSNEYTGLISFRTDWFDQPKGLTRVFSKTTVQKHKFFGTQLSLSFPGGSGEPVKHLPTMREILCQDPCVRKIHWRRKWQLTPVLLPRKSHGWRSLVGYSLQGHIESNTTEPLSISAIFMVQLSQWSMNTGRTKALTIQTFVGK